MFAKKKPHDIFISYRREGGSALAQLVHDALSNRGYRVFMDVHGMGPGRFDEQLKGKIEAAKDVIVLLTLGSLDRSSDEEDWFRQEIALALAKKRNLVPLRVEQFDIPTKEELPEDIAKLPFHQCVTYFHEQSRASIDKVCTVLQSEPRCGCPTWPLIFVLLFLLVCGVAILAWFNGVVALPDSGENDVGQTAAEDPSIQVWRSDTVFQLSHALPLRSGDAIQVAWQLPSSYRPAMFWLDTEGMLHSLEFTKSQENASSDGASLWVWPAPGEANKLGGPKGTEVIVWCATEGESPSIGELQELIEQESAWPSLRSVNWLEWDERQVTLHRDRGPTDVDRTVDDELEIHQRAETLRRALANKFTKFGGVAFPHAE